ncbi:MAG: hypothetical protein ACJAT5_001121 [Lentimonas sp.]|jgi:hypothetical protein
MLHQSIIQLIIAYTLVGAFIFTVVITCLSLVGLVKFADKKQQNRLFQTIIVEVAVISVTFFGDYLKFNPSEVEKTIREDFSPSDVVVKYYFELNENNLSLAYGLLSKDFKRRKSLAEYEINYDFWGIGHVKHWDERIIGDFAEVDVNLRCFNVDGISENWFGTVDLVREEFRWRISSMSRLNRHNQ